MTAVAVRLVNGDTKKLLMEWKPTSSKNISVVSCNLKQVVCAAGSDIFYLDIQVGTLMSIRYFVNVQSHYVANFCLLEVWFALFPCHIR